MIYKNILIMDKFKKKNYLINKTNNINCVYMSYKD